MHEKRDKKITIKSKISTVFKTEYASSVLECLSLASNKIRFVVREFSESETYHNCVVGLPVQIDWLMRCITLTHL